MVSQCATTLFEHLFSLICTLSKHTFFSLFCTLSKKYKYPKDKIISCEELIYVFEEVIYVWKGLLKAM